MGLTIVVYKSLIFFSIAAGIVIISSYISYKIKNRRKNNTSRQTLRYANGEPQRAYGQIPSAPNQPVREERPNYYKETMHEQSLEGNYGRKREFEERPLEREPERSRRRISKERVKVLVPDNFSHSAGGVSSGAISIEARKYLDMIQFYSDE